MIGFDLSARVWEKLRQEWDSRQPTLPKARCGSRIGGAALTGMSSWCRLSMLVPIAVSRLQSNAEMGAGSASRTSSGSASSSSAMSGDAPRLWMGDGWERCLLLHII